MGKRNSNTDLRWASIEKAVRRLDFAASIMVLLMVCAIVAAAGAYVLAAGGARSVNYGDVWSFVKWAFLFYLGNVILDAVSKSLEFWVSNEKIKVQKAAFAAANAPSTGAQIVADFIADTKK